MFLLSKTIVEAVYVPKGYFGIEPYSSRNWVSGSYAFRLGAECRNGAVVPIREPLLLEPGQCAGIWSLERFSMGRRVMGMIGGTSGLLHRGVELLYSPFIDPDFDGCLELLIRNWGRETVALDAGMAIGKAAFFDVSETVASMAEPIPKELPKRYHNRKKAADDMDKSFKAYPEYYLRKLNDPEP